MADQKEEQLLEDSSPEWIRTIDNNGSSKKTKANVFTKNGDRVTLKKVRMPTISTEAVKIASINTPNGFYNASIFVKVDMFQLSCYGVLGIYMANGSITPFAHLSGFCISTVSNILFIKNNATVDIYITGNYNTGYNTFLSDIFSSGELINFEGMGTTVKASSLNVMKSINISDALK